MVAPPTKKAEQPGTATSDAEINPPQDDSVTATVCCRSLSNAPTAADIEVRSGIVPSWIQDCFTGIRQSYFTLIKGTARSSGADHIGRDVTRNQYQISNTASFRPRYSSTLVHLPIPVFVTFRYHCFRNRNIGPEISRGSLVDGKMGEDPTANWATPVKLA